MLFTERVHFYLVGLLVGVLERGARVGLHVGLGKYSHHSTKAMNELYLKKE
jgi:hypothetical protein